MDANLTDCAQAFSEALLELAVADSRHCVVINDSAESHHATEFQRRFPERIIDVGIAEQNMVGVAAGLSNAGLMPWVYSASCFLTARAMEQIKNDIAYHKANVKLCGFISGLSYGELGPTHHAIEDIAWMRAIPGLRVVAPADPFETAAVTRAVAEYEGPVYIRIISRTPVTPFLPSTASFVFGSATQVREGYDVTLAGTGLTTSILLEAAALLVGSGIDARVLNMSSISPIDSDSIRKASRETRGIVVAEEHVLNGGLFSAVAEVVVRTERVPVLPIAIPNEYAPIGSATFLRRHFGLTAADITRSVVAWLSSPEFARSEQG